MESGQHNISEASSSSSSAWIPIDDSRGIWTEFRQRGGGDAFEHRQSNSAEGQSHTNLHEEDLRDWHDDATSPVRNRSERAIARFEICSDSDPDWTMAASISFESATFEARATPKPSQHQAPEEHHTEVQENSEEPLDSSSHPRPESSASSSHHRKTSSGSLWTGIDKAETSGEVEPVTKGNDNAVNLHSSHCKRVNDATSPDTRSAAEKEGSAHSFFRSFVDPFPNDSHSKSKRDPSPLRALSQIISFDFLFGSIPTQEELRETMSLTNNVNSEIGLGLTQDTKGDNTIVIGSKGNNGIQILHKLGYTPGMQVVKINGEACPESLSAVHSALEVRIEVMDEVAQEPKVAIVGVHDSKLELHVHKESKRSKVMYITKVEPHSAIALAGIAPGMRLTKINDKRCPTSFCGLARLLTAQIVAVPKDLAVPIGLETNKTISNLSLPKDEEEDEQSKPGHRRTSSSRYHSSSSTSRKSHLLDQKKSRWLRGGLMAAVQ